MALKDFLDYVAWEIDQHTSKYRYHEYSDHHDYDNYGDYSDYSDYAEKRRVSIPTPKGGGLQDLRFR